MNAEVHNFAHATNKVRALNSFTPAEEALADEALLALFKLRDSLVLRNAQGMGSRVEDVMDRFEGVARSGVRRHG